MVVTLDMLNTGVLMVSRSYSDGSVVFFHATASSDILRAKGLTVGKVYNLDNRKELSEEDVNAGMYNLVTDDTVISDLDKYLNRGVF